jgi:hypothetical protein|tara:strand:- start:45 stop:236 length:192 start_codon:yes stop_codon:yes gene_type:complete
MLEEEVEQPMTLHQMLVELVELGVEVKEVIIQHLQIYLQQDQPTQVVEVVEEMVLDVQVDLGS